MRLKAVIEVIQKRELPDVIGEIAKVQNHINEEFEQNWITATSEPRFK